MHSSPIMLYESVDCFQKKVEDMTAAEAMQCHMINPKYNFISAPNALAWADNQVNFMFCVKETGDIPRAITTLIEESAADRAFLEISVSEMLDLVSNNVPSWDQVYYVINLDSLDDLNRMLAAPASVLKRTFLFEFNHWEDWDDVKSAIDLTHSYGIRTLATSHDNPLTSTVHNHMDIFNAGFDVVYTYNLDNAVTARQRVNTEKGISPP